MNTPPLVLALPLSLELLDEDGAGSLVPAELRYDVSDPFAVTLLLGDMGSPIVWTFAREMLYEGLREPCGDGDVHVWPFSSDQGRAVLLIELVSDDGGALLQADPSVIDAFVELTYDFVAPGEESAYIDLDGLIGAILAA